MIKNIKLNSQSHSCSSQGCQFGQSSGVNLIYLNQEV